MTLLVLALIVTGGRRLRHLRYLRSGGRSILRSCALAESVARWLAKFDAVHVDALLKLNEDRMSSAGSISSV